ncbi:MAG: hypothetical protein DWH86_02930 [Planctomycetota bacterium]|nr:MAG: hypothetical protein DWH86_02930 [Planctomycetota bacterium]
MLATICLTIGGCAADPVPPVLAFPRADYERVFDAVVETARVYRYRPVIADRELGIIETDARASGSLLEPWRSDNDGLQDMMAHTVNFERRRVRFEFVPESFDSPTPGADARAEGAAIAGSTRAEQRFDLLSTKDTIEMRVWVYVDRAFRPNQQIGRWTSGETHVSTDPTMTQTLEDESTRIPTEWTPIGRDVPYEQRLMVSIKELLAATPARAKDDPSGTAPVPSTDSPH